MERGVTSKQLEVAWDTGQGLPEPVRVQYRDRAPPDRPPAFTLEALNNPILAWAELESYRVTGDVGRLRRVWDPLVRYYDALQKYLRQGTGLYVTDFTSMDNSPRNHYLEGGGTAIDTSAQMVLFARNLAEMASVLNRPQELKHYAQEADALSRRINQLMWNESRGFYFDLTLDGKQVPVKTIAAYWTLLARVASPPQAARLVEQLRNPRTFGRPNLVPTLAADEPGYNAQGGAYWSGAVWAPTTTMVIRGLETYGYNNLARRLALQHVRLVSDVYQRTGSIWENYSPERAEHGDPAHKDFVGWSGIGPILDLLEYDIGLKPDAATNTLAWELRAKGRVGCKNFRFNGHVVSLMAEPLAVSGKRTLNVESDAALDLKVIGDGRVMTFYIIPGWQRLVYAHDRHSRSRRAA